VQRDEIRGLRPRRREHREQLRAHHTEQRAKSKEGNAEQSGRKGKRKSTATQQRAPGRGSRGHKEEKWGSLTL
jgi:hypothetical protein